MSLRGRIIWVFVPVILFGYIAASSFFTDEEREASPWISNQGINLGLDLQGGIHWLLGIDQAAAIQQELDRYRDVIEEEAEAQGLEITNTEILDDGDVLLYGDVSLLKGLIEEELETVEVEERGDHVAFRLTEAQVVAVTERGVRQAIEVLQRRIDEHGVREPVIASQGKGRILVQLPGEIDPKRARKFIEGTTFLEFKHVEASAPSEEILTASLPDGVPEDQQIVFATDDDGVQTEALLVSKTPLLTGDLLEDARLGFDNRNQPIVLFYWNTAGAKVFRDYTTDHIGQRMAAIIDNNVITAPTIQSTIGRQGQISGSFSQQEAADLAISLRSGALPIPLIIEEERAVGPALGADSIRQGLRSILIGGVLVILFMLFYYRTAGLLADVTLVVNIILILGMMGFAEATLTLPGIAGLVLTIGMAVDANVIIFERIREELRAGKSMKNAIQIGFKRSSLTILDANVTTMIVALILISYGRGPVQGFGVTLSIGIVSSVFTALIVTRLLVDIWTRGNPERLKV